MALKKSKFKPGQLVIARPLRFDRKTFTVKLIKYIPNYDWEVEYKDSDTGEAKRDTFDERDFDL
jgi:hypothetical protein